MAYDFLGLTNDVNRRLNEVELTSSTFASAVGFYSSLKEGVNSALRTINHQEFEWPFNHILAEEELSTGVTRYSYPSDAKSVDMDSFRIKRDATLGNETKRLRILSYEDYLDKHVDDEYNTGDTSIRSIPTHVFRSPSQEFGVHPVPDKDYPLVYEYYTFPADLILYSDVPTVPEQFRSIIVEGAMYYAYMFRGDNESSQLSLQKFNQGIKDMRGIYINRYEYLRDTRKAF